ncbi:hypothetical protein ATANTOWER_027833 [Ataeniobius toweri]|uniref:CCHC-type domain-containing protein n=1 Tax=Ataeniobius toweri TaxID=208326 RepID=A0ABU7BSN6_9TELE|nr:hypothetical protein [Ataeniobius toweri]
MLAAAQPASPVAHTPTSMPPPLTDQWQGGGFPPPPPYPFYNYRYSGPGRGGGGHVDGQRGRGGWRGAPRGRGGASRALGDVCYNCGQSGHWARAYPNWGSQQGVPGLTVPPNAGMASPPLLQGQYPQMGGHPSYSP